MGRIKGFYTKNGKVRPISESNHKAGTFQKGTASLSMPKRFSNEKIANLKAEKLEAAKKGKEATKDEKLENEYGKPLSKEARAGLELWRKEKSAKISLSEKKAGISKEKENDKKSVLSDAWFGEKFRIEDDKPKQQEVKPKEPKEVKTQQPQPQPKPQPQSQQNSNENENQKENADSLAKPKASPKIEGDS